MPDTGKVTLLLTASTRQFQAATRRAAQATQRLTQTLEQAALKATATFAATGMALKKVASTYATFQSGITRAAIVAGTENEAQIKRMSDTAIELAKTTKFSATEVTEAYNVLAMSGQDANTILASISPTLELASAGAVGLADAADLVTNTIAGFGKSTAELAAVNDALASSITGAKVNVATMGQALKLVGPIANASGVSFESTASALSLMAQGGVDASLAGTGLRRMLINILAPTGTVKTAIDKLGVNFKTAEGKVKNFTEIIRELERVGASTPEELAPIFGTRGLLAAQSLIGAGSAALERFDKRLAAAGGTARRITAAEMATLSGRINSMKASVEGAVISLGSELEPAFRKIANTVGSAADAFSDLRPEIKQFIGGVGIAVAGLSGAVVVLSAFTLAAAGVGPPIRLAIVGLKALGAAALKSLVPMLPIIAAVMGAIVGVTLAIGAGRKVWLFYRDDVIDLWGKIKTAISSFWTWLKDSSIKAMDWMVEAFITASTKVVGTVKGIGAAVKMILGRIVKGEFGGMLTAAGEAFTGELGEADEKAKRLKDTFRAMGGTAGVAGAAGKAISAGVDAAVKGAKQVIDDTKTGLGIMGGFIKDHVGVPLKESFESALELLGPIGKKLRDLLPRMFQFKATLGAGKTGAAAKGKASVPVEVVKEAEGPSKGRQIAETAIGSAGGVVGSVAGGFMQGGPFGALLAIISEFIKASQPLQSLFGMVTKIFNSIVAAFDDLFVALSPLIVIINSLLAPVLELVAAIMAKVGRLIFEIFNALAATWNGLLQMITNLLRGLGDIEIFGKRPFEVLSKLADKLEDNLIIQTQTWDEAQASMSGMNNEIDRATDSMMNVPQVVKLAQRRFEAIAGEGAVQGAAAGAAGTGPGAGGTSIDTVNVYSPEDLDAIVEEVQQQVFDALGQQAPNTGASAPARTASPAASPAPVPNVPAAPALVGVMTGG